MSFFFGLATSINSLPINYSYFLLFCRTNAKIKILVAIKMDPIKQEKLRREQEFFRRNGYEKPPVGEVYMNYAAELSGSLPPNGGI